jgi:hypothetical protein
VKPTGSPTTWFRRLFREALKSRADPRAAVEVDCSDCDAACCREEQPIHLQPEESDEGLEVEWDANKGLRRLKRRADGACVHLADDNRCTVHRRRPWCCRMYDCRVYALAKVTPSNRPRVKAATARWRVTLNTREDHARLLAMVAMRDHLLERGVTDGFMLATRACMQHEDVLRGAVIRS